jgi:hypothetical protein
MFVVSSSLRPECSSLFPVLDTIVQYGKDKVSPSLVKWCLSLALGFLLLALIMTMLGDGEETS